MNEQILLGERVPYSSNVYGNVWLFFLQIIFLDFIKEN